MRKYRHGQTILSSLLILLSAITAIAVAAEMERSDETIAEAVGAELRHSDLVSYEQVRVTVEDGIVSLTGSVPSITASREIEAVTATVRGVRAIVNRLDLDAALLPGTQLRTHILAAWKDNATTDLYELDAVATDEGAVTLSGVVDSWAEYELAETVAGTVSGVRSIENRITVDAARRYRGESEIETDILGRLHWDARVDESLISVLVRDGGRVTLSGTVGSLAEKHLATDLAQVSGVRSVDAAHLNVEPWAQDRDRRLGDSAEVADGDIKAAIARALALDPRVAASDIDIAVVNGAVWLRGHVATLAASRAADRDALNTRGARFVNNMLTVMPPTTDDSQLENQINDSIAMIDGLIGDEVVVTVAGARARIAGNVLSAEQFRRVDEIVANTPGIDSITNGLRIRGELPRVGSRSIMPAASLWLTESRFGNDPVELSDRELYRAVESELFWSPFVDEGDVQIEVDEGAVTLTGHVRSMSELMAAEENAFQAGAQIVNNALEVE